MNPLIRIQPTKDGGRRVLTDECKATVAAWLHMTMMRWMRQLESTTVGGQLLTVDNAAELGTALVRKMSIIRALIVSVDHAFDADAFAESWLWATEVMYGTAVDPAGGGSPGDDIGNRTSSP